MPPRRRPRSWLAGRLRSAAGAVQRLAGLVENTGVPPAIPAEVPRRLGEPPQHWLNLVAAHAPGLLRELDLDATPGGVEQTPGRDDRQDGRGEGGLPSSAQAHPYEVVEGTGSADEKDRRLAERAGRRARGPATQPDDDARGVRASGTADDLGATDGPSTVGGPGAPDGHGLSRTAGLGGRDGLGRTAGLAGTAGVAGTGGSDVLGRMGAVGADGRPDGWRPSGRDGRSGRVVDAGPDGRPGGSGIGSVSPGGDSDAAIHVSGGHGGEAASSPANRRWSGRILDRWPSRPSSWSGAATQTATSAAPVGPARRDTTTTDARVPTRAGVPAAPPLATRRGSPPEIVEEFGPSRGTFQPRSTTAPTAVGGMAVGGADRWPALPDERAQQGGVRATRPAEPDRSHRDQREPSAGQWSVGTMFPASTAVDPWPELPDDTPLWTVPGAALDAGHVDRLDREQAGS